MDKQSLEHGISGTASRFHSNRLPQKYDFISLGDKGAIVYTQAYLQWDKYCNETLRGMNKEIVLTAIKDVEYLLDNFAKFEKMFAILTVNLEKDWPNIQITISDRKNHLSFTLDFQEYYAHDISWNGISSIKTNPEILDIVWHCFGNDRNR